MSEQSFIEFIIDKLNSSKSIELPLKAVCNELFKNKSISDHDISMRLMGFRKTYSIDYIISMNSGTPPTIRFWTIEAPKLIPEIIEGADLCHTSKKNEEVYSTAQ